jgi:hypothetical protein
MFFGPVLLEPNLPLLFKKNTALGFRLFSFHKNYKRALGFHGRLNPKVGLLISEFHQDFEVIMLSIFIQFLFNPFLCMLFA